MSPNTRIGDYEILGELGSGGMGRVYRVRNVISERVEAMKVLLPDLAGRQGLAERFLREIKVLAALNHPNIAALRTALTVDNQLIMIMEYVEGQTLAERLDHGPIATEDALTYLDQVLNALQYAHDQHVIHRDIKPANMMLTPQGVVKLMDFGIARSGAEPALTLTGTTTGSLSYMSPEQVKGGPVDARSDLYSLGISFYEMVTGERPFRADSDYAVMEAHLREAPRPPASLQPGLSSELNDIILKAMAKDPAQRFQSADAFRDAINHLRSASADVATAPLVATLDTTVPAAVLHLHDAAVTPPAQSLPEAAMNQTPSDHARTVVDARTPQPAVQTPLTIVPPPPVVPAPAARTGHPGMYMLLGGVLVVSALVGTALYIERAEATTGKAPDTTQSVQPPPAADKNPLPAPAETAVAPQDAPQAAPTSSSPTVTPPVTSDTSNPTERSPALKRGAAAEGREPTRGTALAATAAKKSAPAKTGLANAPIPAGTVEPAAPPQEPANAAVSLDQLEHEIDQLLARASAVNSSLSRLQQQQAGQGLGLRGDIAARQASLTLNLSKAEEAVSQRNAVRAQRYKALSEADMDALERFLGR